MAELWVSIMILAGIVIFSSIVIRPRLEEWNERQKEKLKTDRYGNKLD